MGKLDQDTDDYTFGSQFAEKFFVRDVSRMRFDFGAATHTGKVRSNNEDHYVVVRRRRANELLLSNLPARVLPLADDVAYGMVVADGMGGENFGEFASRLAVQRMFELSQQASSWVMKCNDLDAQQIRQRVEAYVEEIQRTLREHVATNPFLAGMGTTWTSAHLLPPHALVVHVGDSRAYLLQHGELNQITRDDTVAQAYLDAGVDQATAKKFRHLLLNSLGGDTHNVTARVHLLAIEPGDQLLLCTDGLSEMVNDREIAAILTRLPCPQAACDALIAAALAGGGKDNVTVVLARAAEDAKIAQNG